MNVNIKYAANSCYEFYGMKFHLRRTLDVRKFFVIVTVFFFSNEIATEIYALDIVQSSIQTIITFDFFLQNKKLYAFYWFDYVVDFCFSLYWIWICVLRNRRK